jgi:hypothetical protein
VRAGLSSSVIDEAEIELPSDRLDLLPGDRHQQRVGADAARPWARPRRASPGSSTSCWPAPRGQERRAVDDQRRLALPAAKCGACAAPGRPEREQGPGKRGETARSPRILSHVCATMTKLRMFDQPSLEVGAGEAWHELVSLA